MFCTTQLECAPSCSSRTSVLVPHCHTTYGSNPKYTAEDPPLSFISLLSVPETKSNLCLCSFTYICSFLQVEAARDIGVPALIHFSRFNVTILNSTPQCNLVHREDAAPSQKNDQWGPSSQHLALVGNTCGKVTKLLFSPKSWQILHETFLHYHILR